MNAPTDLPVAQRLAKAFTDLIRNDLTVEQLSELRARNQAHAGTAICASHEFLDARDRMAIAFRAVSGRARDASDADAELWNTAWRLAKDDEFKRSMELIQDAEGNPAYAYSIRGMAIVDPHRSECGRFEADPARDYGLTPQELTDLDDANAQLREEAARKWRRLHENYPTLETYHTGGGCMALRLDCAGDSYLLITDTDGSRLPGEFATQVAAGRYAANGDVWVDAEDVSLDALPVWIDQAVSAASHPSNVGDYFLVKLGEPPEDSNLHSVALHEPCGEYCHKVIDTAVALIGHIRATLGRDGHIRIATHEVVRTPEGAVVKIAAEIVGRHVLEVPQLPTEGALMIFTTADSRLRSRNGQTVRVVRHIKEPDSAHDIEVLPMFEIEFPDKTCDECWADELSQPFRHG